VLIADHVARSYARISMWAYMGTHVLRVAYRHRDDETEAWVTVHGS
jgi:hypothetical protein